MTRSRGLLAAGPTGLAPATARLLAAALPCSRRLAPMPSRPTWLVTPAQACSRTSMPFTPARAYPPPLHHAAAADLPPRLPCRALGPVQTGVERSSGGELCVRAPRTPASLAQSSLPPISLALRPPLRLPPHPIGAPPVSARPGASGGAGRGVTLYRQGRPALSQQLRASWPRLIPALAGWHRRRVYRLGRSRCTPCLGKSDNKHLEKFCPGRPFEPSFSPRRGLLLCSTIR